MKLERWQLEQRQSIPLDQKIIKTKNKIREFYDKFNGKVYVSYSGGKDSEVMLDLIKSIYPNINVVFIDTGTELDTREHAIKKANVILKPKKSMLEIWNKYGIPFPSKIQANFIYKVKHTKSDYLRSRLMTGIMKDGSKTIFKVAEKWKSLIDSDIEVSDKCCDALKKEPIRIYKKQTGEVPFIGTMASDGFQRRIQYLQNGCINLKKEVCTPLGFWTEQDILRYIKENKLDYCNAYGEIVEINGVLKTTKAKRTGCVGCGFGTHLEKEPNRFQRLEVDNPRLHNIILHKWVNGAMGKVLDLCNVNYNKPKVIQSTLLQNNKKGGSQFLPSLKAWVSLR